MELKLSSLSSELLKKDFNHRNSASHKSPGRKTKAYVLYDCPCTLHHPDGALV